MRSAHARAQSARHHQIEKNQFTR